MKVFDLFSGCGGFRLACEKVGFNIVAFCEIDKHAVKLYKNFFTTKDEVYYNNATKIITGELPEFDLLTAGFPCQAFSIAGKRQGFNDTRGTLFLTLYGFSKTGNPDIFFSKTLRAFFLTTMETLLKSSLKVLPSLGITLLNGRCLILNTLDYHKTENGSLLSDILENSVSEKIFLSNRQRKPFSNLQRERARDFNRG